MPATVIAERVGWTGSITWFRDNVRRLRPEHRPVDPSDRLTWLPGDAAQCDLWFPPKKIPLEDGTRTLLPVLVITAAHSRFMLGADDPDPAHRGPAAGDVGAAPAARPGPAAADLGQRVRHRPRQAARRGGRARSPAPWPPRCSGCKPYDPESKGMVERRNGFFETSFMPGRDFASPADFDTQFS